MTTQAELIKLAEKHKSNPAISALLLSLQEARMMVQPSIQAMQGSANVVDLALKGEPDFSIPLDNSHIVVQAAKLSASLTRMASDFFTLATVLQALGEDVSY